MVLNAEVLSGQEVSIKYHTVLRKKYEYLAIECAEEERKCWSSHHRSECEPNDSFLASLMKDVLEAELSILREQLDTTTLELVSVRKELEEKYVTIDELEEALQLKEETISSMSLEDELSEVENLFKGDNSLEEHCCEKNDPSEYLFLSPSDLAEMHVESWDDRDAINIEDDTTHLLRKPLLKNKSHRFSTSLNCFKNVRDGREHTNSSSSSHIPKLCCFVLYPSKMRTKSKKTKEYYRVDEDDDEVWWQEQET